MNFKKIAWNLGLTKLRKTELSDVIYETGRVTSKEHKEVEDNLLPVYTIGDIAFGVADEDAKYKIIFAGEKTAFEVDDKTLFQSFKLGERIELIYQKKFSVTYDYKSPDFDKKKEISRVVSGYNFVSAKKI